MRAVVERAVEALARGELAIVPTDTVYGVAARVDRPDAVARVFALKGRPADKPLPVLGADDGALETVVAFDDDARRLAGAFWPGPLTLVLPRAPGFDADLGGAAPDVGVRVPARAVTLALLERTGPLAVTSANRSGEPPALTAAAARAALPGVAVVVDDGELAGTPSTVAALAGGLRVVRAGPVSADSLRAALYGRS
ncbi:MAG TPA: L-threonylcarbamoyladenylate synthase [Actinomycetota bacterium]|nr:L-threonylcarbamoyladenylate synthase [Actinomycetota bacterium]